MSPDMCENDDLIKKITEKENREREIYTKLAYPV